MNFNFHTPKSSGGFTLPTTPTTQAATPGSLTFASGDNRGLTPGQTGAKTAAFGNTFAASPAPSTGGFQLGTPASSAPALSFGGTASAQSVSFGASLATPAAPPAVTNTSALAGFSLGSTLAQTSAPSLLTGSLATSVTPNLTLGAVASAAPSFNLSNTSTTSSTTGGISSTGLTLGTPATTSTAAGGFTLGKVGLAPAASVPASTGFALATPPATTAATALPNTAAPAAASSTALGDQFTFAKLEEALNKWTLELDDQGKMFLNQALQLNAWDRLVIANGEKILSLNNGIEKVKQQQQQLDHELDFVLAQQRELEECIVPLEKELRDVPISDQDRNHTYQMAENLDTQLKQMSENLKEIIEHLNESNKTEDTNDPVAKIGRILNAHMNSLQWIDRNTAQISTFLDQITKMHDMHRRDNERSFHLTYE